MNSLSSRGRLSVEDLNALFEDRLRIKLHCGSFKVIQHYSNKSNSKIYDQQLPLSMVIRLEREGRGPLLNAAPGFSAVSASASN